MATTTATALPPIHSSGVIAALSKVNESSSDAQTEDELEDSDEDDSEPDLEVDAMADALLQDIKSQILAQLDPSVVEPQPTTNTSDKEHAMIPPMPSVTDTTSTKDESESEDEDENPMISTINVILTHAASNPPVKAALDSTPVPCAGGASLFTVLSQAVATGGVTPELAEPLSVLIAELARTPQPPSSFTSVSPPKGKRKREASDDGGHLQPSKQPRMMQPLGPLIPNAVGTITRVMQSGPISAQMISSLQTELHDVFVFASAASGIPISDAHSLQQILNLIHALSLMSGIQIGSYPPPSPATTAKSPSTEAPPTSNRAAIHPCQFPGCPKTFTRLALLRNHARLHTVHRPYKCSHCPASFLRNHDLVRHVRGHSNTAFRCIGCNKTFTRRDAAKRHKENPKSYPACKSAEVQPVYVEGNTTTPRRGDKMWSTAKVAQDMAVTTNPDEVEEGELSPPDVGHALILVQSLHALLHGHVSHWQTVGGHAMINTPNQPFPTPGAFAYTSYLPERPPPQYDPALFADSPTQHGGLDQDQTSMLEQAIAFASAEAQEEALLEEEDDDDDDDDEENEID